MRKARVGLKILLTVFVFGCILGTTTCASSSPVGNAGISVTRTALHASVTISRAQDLFAPFLLAIQPYTVVTWHNDDTLAHVFTTSYVYCTFLYLHAFSLTVLPGQSRQFTFTQPGLYHYYDPTAATWNTTFSRVAARRGSSRFPLAMDAVIWVQGPISGLPTAALNSIPAGHDEYTREFLAVSSPAAVSWHNFDEDAHFFGQVPNWPTPINPADVGLYRMSGTHDVPGGQTITILFDTPGLYYYYCRNHDQVDAATRRAQALTKASEYPLPMEGFLLVVGR